MAWSDWLSEVPFVGGAIDTIELVSSALGVVASASSENYSEIRDSMIWSEVGNTGLDTRNFLLAEQSLVPVTWDATGREVVAGKWEDINGFASTDPEDFDIDHRVSFHQVVMDHPNFAELSQDEQLAIYNDRENLQILHDAENMKKSNASPMEYAQRIRDPEARAQFLADAKDYISERIGRYRG